MSKVRAKDPKRYQPIKCSDQKQVARQRYVQEAQIYYKAYNKKFLKGIAGQDRLGIVIWYWYCVLL